MSPTSDIMINLIKGHARSKFLCRCKEFIISFIYEDL